MTRQPDDSDIPALTPTFRFQWEEAQGCFVILYPEGMVKLSATAGEIMKHCDGSKCVRDVISALEAQFPGVELAADVRKFLEDAHEHGWIRYQSR